MGSCFRWISYIEDLVYVVCAKFNPLLWVAVCVIECVVEGDVDFVNLCYCKVEGYISEWDILRTLERVEERLGIHVALLSKFAAFIVKKVHNCICKFFLSNRCNACFMKAI